jgi:hypothetical protein
MLFQVAHTHSNENCPGAVPELATKLGAWWQALKSNPDVKVVSGYVSPMDHTIYIALEASDYPPVARALGGLNSIGSGHTSPVIPLDQAFPMAQEGAFRLSQ